MPYDILCGALDCKHNREVTDYHLRDGRHHQGGCCVKVGIILYKTGIVANGMPLLKCEDYEEASSSDKS